MNKEAMGRLILEASTGMRGDVAKQLSDAWSEMAKEVETLTDALRDALPYINADVNDPDGPVARVVAAITPPAKS